MNKPWIGFLSSFLLLLAGVLMIAGGELAVGIFFLVAAVGGLVLRLYMSSKKS